MHALVKVKQVFVGFHAIGLTIVAGVLFFAILLWLTFHPILLGTCTFVLSVLLLERITYDQAVHNFTFYSTQTAKARLQAFLHYGTVAKVWGKSALLGLLAAFLFSGTDQQRIGAAAFFFLITVFLGFALLRGVERYFSYQIMRWGYIRLSILLGVLLSALLSTREPSTVGTAFGFLWSSIANLSLGAMIELLHSTGSLLDNLTRGLLTAIFGDFIGSITALFCTVHILYGFVAYVYVAVLYRVVRRLQQKA